MVVRMSQGDRVYGFLSVVLELAYPVDEEERALLEEVADDLAFALRGIELERQREENLWELRLMDSAIDSAMAPICFLDLHGRLTFVNSSFLKMWGYDSEEEVLGKPAADFMDLEYQWTEDAWIGDLSARRRDGSYFSVYLTANKVQTEDGQPICVMLSAVDTTDRRRAEEQLKQAHAFLKSLIDSVPDIIFHKDVEGRYQLVNRTMARFLGKAEEEILDRTDADILPPEEAERILAMDRQVMDGQISRIHEEVITTADDRSMVLETVKTPQLAPDGQVIGLFGVSRDITDRIAAENALREKEVARVAAVEASHMKDEFLAAMSHEIRTPLGGMTGFAQTLKRLSDRGRLSPDQFESIIENIVSSGRHLTNLVEDIMDITRIEAGHIEVNPEEVNLGQVLDSLASSFAEQARQKQMSVDFTSNPDLPSVRADGKRLNQILYNLIGNAIKYTEEGSVRVWAEIDSDRPDMVRVSVVDTGPGIDEKDQSKIFDRFTRLSGADKVTGAGLGLAITSRLVQLMGGRIWVESRLGRGAAFRFTLPVWAETAPART
jgi:PAS domain S-box-containing protein